MHSRDPRKNNGGSSPRTSTKTYSNYIGGKWVPSRSGEVFENLNPADTRDVIGRFSRSTSEDVNDAVNAARGHTIAGVIHLLPAAPKFFFVSARF